MKSALEKVYFAHDGPHWVCQFIVRVVLLVALRAELDVCSCGNVILQPNSRCISTDFALACSKRYVRVAGVIMFVIMD